MNLDELLQKVLSEKDGDDDKDDKKKGGCPTCGGGLTKNFKDPDKKWCPKCKKSVG
jgi:hypothetical protein